MDRSTRRAWFPILDERVHLNHAGVSPVSERVAATLRAFADHALHLRPGDYERWEARAEAARESFARLIGAGADEIAFVKNTSEGLSLVAAGLTWREGDNVVAIEGEYPANVYPWWALRDRGVETRMLASAPGDVTVDALAPAVDARTRLVAVSFVDWTRGGRVDLAALAGFCRERNVLLCVDGIQGIGALPFDVAACGVDFVAVGGHKWLLAPEGCGCLYVARRHRETLSSVLHGWKSVTNATEYYPYHFDPRPDAARFEPGTPSVVGAAAFGAAVDLLLEVGPAVVERRILDLTDRFADGLRARGADILSPWERDRRSGILVFRLGESPDTLVAGLREHGVTVRTRNGGVRVAPHFYQDEEDVERFFAALDRAR